MAASLGRAPRHTHQVRPCGAPGESSHVGACGGRGGGGSTPALGAAGRGGGRDTLPRGGGGAALVLPGRAPPPGSGPSGRGGVCLPPLVAGSGGRRRRGPSSPKPCLARPGPSLPPEQWSWAVGGLPGKGLLLRAAGGGTRGPFLRCAFLEAFVGACSTERFKEARSAASQGGERIVCDMWCCCSFFSKPEEALGAAGGRRWPERWALGRRWVGVVKCCSGWSVDIAFKMSRLPWEQLI